MHPTFQYILLSTGCLGITFLLYRLLLANRTVLTTARLFLLIAVLFSLLAPLSNFSISPGIFQTTAVPSTGNNIISEQTAPVSVPDVPVAKDKMPATKSNIRTIVLFAYMAVVLFFIIRIGRQFYAIIVCYRKSQKEKRGHYTIVWNDQYKSPFSFFHLVFLHTSYQTDQEQDKVIAHEEVHVAQYHSIDIIFMELLLALMWFNPFLWLVRNALQSVHEYLADEGTLNKGIDKLQYQELLLNRIAETKFVSLYSGFNHSLIKKRFLMMSKAKSSPATKYRIFSLAPVAAALLLGIGCVNGQTNTENPKVVTAVAPTKMNVLYIGVDNPVTISASGYTANEIEISTDNGTIKGEKGEYIVHPAKPGMANITVSAKGKIVNTAPFRVKYLPGPAAVLQAPSGKQGFIRPGNITKDELLKAGGVITGIESSEFDVQFKVTSFTISTTMPDNSMKAASSGSNKYSQEQINLIKSLKKDQKVFFYNINATGPDGRERSVPSSMVFTIVD